MENRLCQQGRSGDGLLARQYLNKSLWDDSHSGTRKKNRQKIECRGIFDHISQPE